VATSDQLKLLVTSRIALRVTDEREYAVPSLTLPPRDTMSDDGEVVTSLSGYGAIRLFVERAQAVRGDFALTRANARDVIGICHRLDGLPLAIELAAARARLLPPAAMLARLGGSVEAPSLQLLTGGSRDRPARQQTLRNTIAWSYDLLEPEEQALFRRLAVFVGGCTIEAAERVCSGEMAGSSAGFGGMPLPAIDVLDGIDALLTRSLLRRLDSESSEPRYTMLETIRELGLESLERTGERRTVRRWHAEYYLALAETAEPLMRGPEQRIWLDTLEAERDNLRAALEWSLSPDGDSTLALRLTGALAWYWYNRSHLDEARRWLAQALARETTPSLARVKALAGAGRLAHIQQRSAEARPPLQECLALARALGDRWWTAWALHLLGRVHYFDGDAHTARAFGQESLAVSLEIEDAWLEGWALHLLGLASQIEADYPTARRFLEASMVIRRRIQFHEGISTLDTLLGLIDFAEGDYAAVVVRLRESVDLLWRLDDGWLKGNLIAQYLALSVRLGQPQRGARLWGALTALSEAVSVRPIPLFEAILWPALEQARRELDAAAFTAAHEIGRRMVSDEVRAELLDIEVPASAAAPPSVSDPSDRSPPTTARPVLTRPAGLSAREVEVLRLIAAGRTTREIADELVITVNTVESHVTRVYQKIGARGRAEATAFAYRHGLA
jgi:predicted ATPase/DNA-binding CsgD family transcriptional regulator